MQDLGAALQSESSQPACDANRKEVLSLAKKLLSRATETILATAKLEDKEQGVVKMNELDAIRTKPGMADVYAKIKLIFLIAGVRSMVVDKLFELSILLQDRCDPAPVEHSFLFNEVLSSMPVEKNRYYR